MLRKRSFPALVGGLCSLLLLRGAPAALAQCDQPLAVAAGPTTLAVITLKSDLSGPMPASPSIVGHQVPVGIQGTLVNVPPYSTEQLFVQRPDGTVIAAPMDPLALTNPLCFEQDQFALAAFFDLTVPGTWRVLLAVNGQTLVDLPFQVVAPAGDSATAPGQNGTAPGGGTSDDPVWSPREEVTFTNGMRSADPEGPVGLDIFINGQHSVGLLNAPFFSAGDIAQAFQAACAK